MIRPGALLLTLAIGCARIAPPPGGPPDQTPPLLVRVSPDSVRALPGFRGQVEFEFDRVLSEGSQPNFGLGSGSLEQLVLVSPGDQVPVVRWRRNRITVRAREGWRPNTTYRVELLPGVRDLRNNEWRQGTTVTFSTGEQLPGDTLAGRVVDWSQRRPTPNALVIAVLLPDSLAYRTRADSTGSFAFGPLPAGEYLVYGVVDQNRNNRLDAREFHDTVRVTTGDSVGDIWAFRHDSMPARIQQIDHVDSITATVAFNMMLDPTQRVPVESITVALLPDSVPVALEALLPREAFDSLFRTPPAADTAAADTALVRPGVVAARPGVPPDTTGRGPITTRPALFDRLMLRVTEPFLERARYHVRIRGVRSVSGVEATVEAVLAIPAAPLPPPTDTVATPPDTIPPARAGGRR